MLHWVQFAAYRDSLKLSSCPADGHHDTGPIVVIEGNGCLCQTEHTKGIVILTDDHLKSGLEPRKDGGGCEGKERGVHVYNVFILQLSKAQYVKCV